MAHQWYIVHAYSNFEKKVADAIKEQAEQKGLMDHFEEILVPTEEVVELRRGQRVNAERKFFPGYVLVKMNMTDETYHLVKNTPKVTGFLGTGNKPLPVPQSEIDQILHQDRHRPCIGNNMMHAQERHVSVVRSPEKLEPDHRSSFQVERPVGVLADQFLELVATEMPAIVFPEVDGPTVLNDLDRLTVASRKSRIEFGMPFEQQGESLFHRIDIELGAEFS